MEVIILLNKGSEQSRILNKKFLGSLDGKRV